MMSPIHLRMARAALNWTVRELAARSGVNKNAVSRYESGQEIVSGSLRSLEEVLTKEGVIFFDDDKTYGTGVGLKKRHRSK
jgi:transcriptional regulator with XRE-family HTH domain